LIFFLRMRNSYDKLRRDLHSEREPVGGREGKRLMTVLLNLYMLEIIRVKMMTYIYACLYVYTENETEVKEWRAVKLKIDMEGLTNDVGEVERCEMKELQHTYAQIGLLRCVSVCIITVPTFRKTASMGTNAHTYVPRAAACQSRPPLKSRTFIFIILELGHYLSAAHINTYQNSSDF